MSNIQRRQFLKSSGLFTAGFLASRLPLMAGPFTDKDYADPFFPEDKKLDKGWLKSLYERGNATVYTKAKNELRFIGMPVGGICCGTVYLGGDGRLWVWDIFNRNQLGAVQKDLPLAMEAFNTKVINNMYGTLYLSPAENVSPLQQGFALVIRQGNSKIVKRLHQDDWEEVSFEATYPVGVVRYRDKTLPLEVVLHGYSPFIPGDAHNSGLPATVQSISFRNLSAEKVSVEVIGWLENKLLLDTASEKKDIAFKRVNKQIESEYCQGMSLEVVSEDAKLVLAPDYGNMSLVSIGKKGMDGDPIHEVNDFIRLNPDSPMAVVATSHVLQPGQEDKTDFVISWYTPNVSLHDNEPEKPTHVLGSEFRYYTSHFSHSQSVATYLAKNFAALREQTFLWKDVWYDSTLPWWFLERTLMNVSTLATSASYRFSTGRFYASEGVGCCEGTCMHVYQYAHAMARIFPELERDMRERVDLGFAFEEATGKMGYRGEGTKASIDGQAGTILRIYREHQMSKDGMLAANWDRIRKAIEFVMKQDKNGDGMEDTPMENTLDAQWSGEIAWIVGLCIAAVLAGQRMAEEMNDRAFARICAEYVAKGRENMERYLFNGEYFIHRPDKEEGIQKIGSYNTCHIDQVYGQSWAFQVGLGRVLDEEKTKSALRSLWKYNYMPDVGPYIKKHPGGRFYAVAGDGGMIMNTNPKNDPHPYGMDIKAWQIGYFSECMSGFEHQVAAHMMAEGMIEESLVLTRSIHDRYHASKRNPFNEIECSDHYGRAMAAYGTFISACGFTYHGPKGEIGFAPVISPQNFKAPFTVAEGWGTYTQHITQQQFSAQLKMAQGSCRLQKIKVVTATANPGTLTVHIGAKKIGATLRHQEKNCEILLAGEFTVHKNETLTIAMKA